MPSAGAGRFAVGVGCAFWLVVDASQAEEAGFELAHVTTLESSHARRAQPDGTALGIGHEMRALYRTAEGDIGLTLGLQTRMAVTVLPVGELTKLDDSTAAAFGVDHAHVGRALGFRFWIHVQTQLLSTWEFASPRTAFLGPAGETLTTASRFRLGKPFQPLDLTADVVEQARGSIGEELSARAALGWNVGAQAGSGYLVMVRSPTAVRLAELGPAVFTGPTLKLDAGGVVDRSFSYAARLRATLPIAAWAELPRPAYALPAAVELEGRLRLQFASYSWLTFSAGAAGMGTFSPKVSLHSRLALSFGQGTGLPEEPDL